MSRSRFFTDRINSLFGIKQDGVPAESAPESGGAAAVEVSQPAEESVGVADEEDGHEGHAHEDLPVGAGVAYITSHLGERNDPINKGKKQDHKGIDLSVARGSPVYAVYDGVVSAAGFESRGGNFIYVDTVDPSGVVHQFRYLHLDKIDVQRGQDVRSGEKIGESGSTGARTTAPHLHFEYRIGPQKGEKQVSNPTMAHMQAALKMKVEVAPKGKK